MQYSICILNPAYLCIQDTAYCIYLNNKAMRQ